MSDNVETKVLCVRKIGWKRIARNTQRFGWYLDNAEQHTTTTETTTYEGSISGDTITVTPHTTRSSKVRVWLSFYRYSSEIPASVKTVELFYNLFFLVRRIIGFLLPIALIPYIILFLLGQALSDLGSLISMYWMIAFFSWIALMIIEGILARVGHSLLRR